MSVEWNSPEDETSEYAEWQVVKKLREENGRPGRGIITALLICVPFWVLVIWLAVK